MMSIFRTVMGSDFDRLHPQLQRRFSVGLASGEACTGRGVMTRVWHGPAWVRPFLLLGATRNILLPRGGRNIPFTIENVPYADTFGRETVTFVRTFHFPGRAHRFDAQMVLGPHADRIVDYLGTHQHLASDLYFRAEPDGSLLVRSGEHRFREGPVDVRVPELLGATAEVRESYDDATDRFRIRVRVTNRRMGPLFGYEGSFTATYTDVRRCGVRPGLRPVREEPRV
ncbi:DUF4166 domain-containing protein [Streptomyces sp. XM83C]|jgi:hypothetical protein|uniref:DUF4166 domain-containing protein n=1 Tax=Streptomyces thermocoprophilus TaxID=78356 RepID=A0ABV5VCI5_9ACTN|nr:DUF4166 domain-containing protein [Streptomyces sp. XM83C]MCK1819634.1 DUF4166 domain-containing protein [Streptomyces sp. XM83C]